MKVMYYISFNDIQFDIFCILIMEHLILYIKYYKC